MFSGIVETTGKILKLHQSADSVRLSVARPTAFADLKTGDSVAVDGVCLTLRELTDQAMSFDVGYETLKVCHWQQRLSSWQAESPEVGLNLERSLKFGDRVHGHIVTGHVETLAMLQESFRVGESLVQRFIYPLRLRHLLWSKGSVALNGVSLTINDMSQDYLEVCLVPETQERTNLRHLKLGDWVHLEPDSMAKSISTYLAHSPLLGELVKTEVAKFKDQT